MRHRIFTMTALLLASASTLAAQVEIERRLPAPAKGRVWIENPFGAVVVRAHDKAEVAVRGTLAAGAEELGFDVDKEGASIDVDVPEAWFHAPGEEPSFRSMLEVTVPVGSTVDVETVNATVEIGGVTGEIEVTTVNGAVKIDAPTRGVEVETMTGAVDVRALQAPMSIRTVSGAVTVAGATGEIRIESVSGRVEVAGASVAALEVETTTGPVVFKGTLARAGEMKIQTFSSPVAIELPRGVRTAFDLTTFAGKIQSDFCAGTPVVRDRFEPYRQLRCSTGPEGFEIEVRTHDADITIAAAGGGQGEKP